MALINTLPAFGCDPAQMSVKQITFSHCAALRRSPVRLAKMNGRNQPDVNSDDPIAKVSCQPISPPQSSHFEMTATGRLRVLRSSKSPPHCRRSSCWFQCREWSKQLRRSTDSCQSEAVLPSVSAFSYSILSFAPGTLTALTQTARQLPHPPQYNAANRSTSRVSPATIK